MKQVYNVIELNNIINIDELGDIGDSYCVGIKTINKLTNYDMYPIDKNKAIKKVLDFLNNFDCMSNKATVMPIHSDVFRFYFGGNYKQYLTILHELNILSFITYPDGKGAIKNERSALFTLMNEYVYDEVLALVIFSNAKPLKLSTDKKYNTKLTKTISKIQIDYSKAIPAEIEYYKTKQNINVLRQRLNILLSLSKQRYIKSGVKSERVYHSLSNVSKVSRPYLNYKGQYFTGLDIVNCQPLLLCLYLKKQGMAIDQTYINDCESGQLYERFYGVKGMFKKFDGRVTLVEQKDFTYNVNNVDEVRKGIKVELYNSIYFDFKKDNIINQKFKELYPETYSSLELLDNDQDTLASKLQNIEAGLINDIIPAVSKGYYTLFDGIYVTDADDLVAIESTLQDKFKAFGLTVIFKREK